MLRAMVSTGIAVAFLGMAAGCKTPVGMEKQAGVFYVSPGGDDAWSGMLAGPTADRSDGPFRTLQRARDAVRAADSSVTRRVVLRGGTHYLDSVLELGPEDSGTAAAPVVWEAYPGEKPIISGGRKITGWQERDGGIWAAPVPDARTGAWEFRQLRVDDEAQILARYPNYDPENPTKGGWLFARESEGGGGWQTSMSRTHTPGDWMEWDVDVPVAGDYALWLYYGHHMKPYGRDNMDGQTVFQVDGGADIPLSNLPDSGGWNRFRWSRCATLTLSAGKHTLRWTNRKGGGLNFNAFAVCDDVAWQAPETGGDLAEPAAGKHLLVFQAEKHDRGKGKEMTVEAGSPKGRKDRLPFVPGDIPTWDLEGAQIMVFPAWGWVGGRVQVGGVDHKKGYLQLTGKNAQQDIRIGNRYFIENVREALDVPGEFFLDRRAGELLYMPTSKSFVRQDVVAPVLDRLIEVKGDSDADTWPEHIHFRGLLFRDSRYSIAVPSLYTPQDAAIWFDHARHMVVKDCTFSLLGGYAVHMLNRTTRCKVLGCRMFDMGQGGVVITGDTASQATDCVIAGCRMHDLGTIYKHVAGVYVTTGSGHRISHCTITDVPRYAISFKSFGKTGYSHKNIAEYNEILRTNLETNDTGAIETLGRDHGLTGNVIRYNLILDVIGMKHTAEGGILSPHYTWGIYLDDYSSGTHIYGNIVARTVRGGYHNHLGFDNIVENNIFIDGRDYQAEWNGKSDMRRNVFRRNIVTFSDPEAVYIKASGWDPDVLKDCDYNVVWWTGGDVTTSDVTPCGTWDKWQAAGFGQHSVVADPCFVNPEKDDYRLRPDSPAHKLGFEPIPVEKIGVKGYAPAAF